MIHWHPPTGARTSCLVALTGSSSIGSTPFEVTCPACKAALRAYERATDETLRSAPAVTRRMPSVR